MLHRPRQDACQLELGRAVAGSCGADAAAADRLRRLAALGRRRLLELSAVWMLPTTKKDRTVVELATALLGAQGGEMEVEQLQGGPNWSTGVAGGAAGDGGGAAGETEDSQWGPDHDRCHPSTNKSK